MGFNFALNSRSNVQFVFSGYFEGANLFASVCGPDNHAGEVRFCVKTMRKKVDFSGFIYSVKISGKVGEI